VGSKVHGFIGPKVKFSIFDGYVKVGFSQLSGFPFIRMCQNRNKVIYPLVMPDLIRHPGD
jgi:hypothetical protein